MPVLQQYYLVLIFLVLLGCGTGARPTLAQQGVGPNDWPQFRGPTGNGVSNEKGWSVTWPDSGPKQLWKINVGTGASSVTVCNGHLYTMGNIDDQDIIYCLDPATDKEIWRYAYPAKYAKRSYEGGTASTPTTDGKRVYALGALGLLNCLDAQTGKFVWSKDLKQEGGKPGGWLYAASPLIDGSLILVDAGGKGQANLAFNKDTGEVVWKSGDGEASYATAVAYTVGTQRMATFFRIKTGVVGVDVSTGKQSWQIPWLGAHGAPTATPVVEGDKMFITTRGTTGGQCAMLQLTDGAAKIVWQSEDLDCHVASAVIWQGYIYGINGTLNSRNAELRCLDLATGVVKWGQKGMGTGALILADGKLIVLGDRGDLLVAQATPEGFKQLAKAHVIDGHCWVQPVLSNGRLYCRSNQGDLVCLDLSGK